VQIAVNHSGGREIDECLEEESLLLLRQSEHCEIAAILPFAETRRKKIGLVKQNPLQ